MHQCKGPRDIKTALFAFAAVNLCIQLASNELQLFFSATFYLFASSALEDEEGLHFLPHSPLF